MSRIFYVDSWQHFRPVFWWSSNPLSILIILCCGIIGTIEKTSQRNLFETNVFFSNSNSMYHNSVEKEFSKISKGPKKVVIHWFFLLSMIAYVCVV